MRPGCGSFVAVEKETPILDVGTLAASSVPGARREHRRADQRDLLRE